MKLPLPSLGIAILLLLFNFVSHAQEAPKKWLHHTEAGGLGGNYNRSTYKTFYDKSIVIQDFDSVMYGAGKLNTPRLM